MNIEEIKNLIAKVDLFANLNTAERDLIAGAVEVADYEADSLLFVENSPRSNIRISVETYAHGVCSGDGVTQ